MHPLNMLKSLVYELEAYIIFLDVQFKPHYSTPMTFVFGIEVMLIFIIKNCLE